MKLFRRDSKKGELVFGGRQLMRNVKVAFSFLLSALLPAGTPGLSSAQTTAVSVSLSEQEVQAHDTVTIELSLDIPADAYYFSVKVVYDPSVLAFIEATPGTVMMNSVHIADSLAPGVIGASVTRTDQTTNEADGSLLILTFRVHETAPAGSSVFGFEQLELTDSGNGDLGPEGPEEREVTVGSSISRIQLQSDEDLVLTEGDVVDVTGQIYVNGVTDLSDEAVEVVRVWAGLNTLNSDPSDWLEDAWTELQYSGADGEGFHLYSGTLSSELQNGVYYLALRATYDAGDFSYGGVPASENDPFWNGTTHTSEVVTVEERPLFRYGIIEWDFENNSLLASSALPQNMGRELHIAGANPGEFASGADGVAANATGWNEPDSGEKYWLAHFGTTGLVNIEVSSQQYSSGSGPGRMSLQASPDGEAWADVGQDVIEIESNWSKGVVTNVSLGSQYEDRESVYLRWVVESDTRADGEPEISAQGTSRIDNISITGENKSPVDISVWPGDTDHDQQVNETDVLPLGLFWLSEGPQPLYNTTEWEERLTESWIPLDATYADTDGNGVVDHRDLKIIGLNFGEIQSGMNRVGPVEKPASFPLNPMKSGESVHLSAMVPGTLFLNGIAFTIEISGIPRESYTIESVNPGPWADKWVESGKLMSFYRENPANGQLSVAFFHKGAVPEMPAERLVSVEISAATEWQEDGLFRLTRISGSGRNKIHDILPRVEIGLHSEAYEKNPDESNAGLKLLQNFPNPADRETTVGYWLEEESEITLELFDLTGRLIRILVHREVGPGYREIDLKTERLAGGLYILRLRTDNVSESKKMMVVH